MDVNDITYKIIGCAFEVHKTLGPGLLESIYEKALIIELNKIGLSIENQITKEVVYKGINLNLDYRLDILVNDTIIIELKSVEELKPVHFKQLQTYLKLFNKEYGLLINFNVDNLRNSIHRVLNPYYKNG